MNAVMRQNWRDPMGIAGICAAAVTSAAAHV